MINAQLDQLFDSAFDVVDSLEPIQVDHRQSWLMVQKRLNKRNKNKRIRSALAKLAVVAASLMIGAALFGNTRAAKAIDPIYSTLKEYPSGLMSFFFGREEDSDPSGAKTAPPPAYAEGLNVEKIDETTYRVIANQEQAVNLLSYRAPAFGFIPEGYAFKEAQLLFRDGKEKADSVTYLFINEIERPLLLYMDRLKPNTALSTVTQTGGATSEKIEVDGIPAILYLSGQDSYLETIKDGIFFQISGRVPPDNLIQMYEELYKD
jgi:hypothetical protein